MFVIEKRPVMEMYAIRWDGTNLEEVKDFVGDRLECKVAGTNWDNGVPVPHHLLFVKTKTGNLSVFMGDYIIKESNGDIYPCNGRSFHDLYRIVSQM